MKSQITRNILLGILALMLLLNFYTIRRLHDINAKMDDVERDMAYLDDCYNLKLQVDEIRDRLSELALKLERIDEIESRLEDLQSSEAGKRQENSFSFPSYELPQSLSLPRIDMDRPKFTIIR